MIIYIQPQRTPRETNFLFQLASFFKCLVLNVIFNTISWLSVLLQSLLLGTSRYPPMNVMWVWPCSYVWASFVEENEKYMYQNKTTVAFRKSQTTFFTYTVISSSPPNKRQSTLQTKVLMDTNSISRNDFQFQLFNHISPALFYSSSELSCVWYFRTRLKVIKIVFL